MPKRHFFGRFLWFQNNCLPCMERDDMLELSRSRALRSGRCRHAQNTRQIPLRCGGRSSHASHAACKHESTTPSRPKHVTGLSNNRSSSGPGFHVQPPYLTSSTRTNSIPRWRSWASKWSEPMGVQISPALPFAFSLVSFGIRGTSRSFCTEGPGPRYLVEKDGGEKHGGEHGPTAPPALPQKVAIDPGSESPCGTFRALGPAFRPVNRTRNSF